MTTHDRIQLAAEGAFEFDGDYVWVYEAEAVSHYHLPSGERRLRKEAKYPRRLCLVPDRDFGFLAKMFRKVVDIVDASTLTRRDSLKGHRKPVTQMALSPDGSRLATGAEDGTVRLWDVDSLQTVATLEYEPSQKGESGQRIDELYFLDGGRWLCSVGFWTYPNSTLIWEVDSAERIAAFAEVPTDVAIEDDALYLKFAPRDGDESGQRETISVFDYVTAEVDSAQSMPERARVERLLYRRVLDIYSPGGEKIARLGPFGDEVGSFGFDPDRQRLAAVADGQLWWWSVEALESSKVEASEPGRQIGRLFGLEDASAVQRLKVYKAPAAALGTSVTEAKGDVDDGHIVLPDRKAAEGIEEQIAKIECVDLWWA